MRVNRFIFAIVVVETIFWFTTAVEAGSGADGKLSTRYSANIASIVDNDSSNRHCDEESAGFIASVKSKLFGSSPTRQRQEACPPRPQGGDPPGRADGFSLFSRDETLSENPKEGIGAWASKQTAAPFEAAWRSMETSYTLFEISVYGSAILHLVLAFTLSLWPLLCQNLERFQKYKIQKGVPPASPKDWGFVVFWVFLSQFLVQLPLVTGNFYFMQYFQIPYSYQSMPGGWDMAWRVAAAFVIEDTWHYFLHRALHHKSVYKYIHKLHHTYTSPFGGIQAEFAHPAETVILGIGFFVALLLLCNHLAFMWLWLALRLVETFDIHTGYDIPWNPLKLVPGYGGVRAHDFHHQKFNGNYASTFVWWDLLLGTNSDFIQHQTNQRREDEKDRIVAMHAHAETLYPGSPAVSEPLSAKGIEALGRSFSLAPCLVTGASGMVGKTLVEMLASRGAPRVVCMDILAKPVDWDKYRSDFQEKYACKLEYFEGDISDNKAMLPQPGAAGKSPFQDIEICFHVAAVVGPFHSHKLYEAVNHQGARNVLAACKASGVRTLVDCSTPSTRFNGYDIEGRCESELAYASVHEYARTKTLGEKAILAANGDGIATCAVAPHQVYGPKDMLFLPAFLETARSGKLRIFGSGSNVVSFTHMDNICHALCLAGVKLALEGSDSEAGGEFFVATDGDSGIKNLWDVIDSAIVECGMPSLHSKASLPSSLLWVIAHLGAVFTALTGKMVKLTPFTLNMLVIHRYFCVAKASQILGYQPIRHFDEGWAETVQIIKKRMEDELAAKASARTPAAAQGIGGIPTGILSSNPVKRSGERFFLWWSVAWIGLMVVIVATRAFATFTPWDYMYVGMAIGCPCVLLPILFPSKEEADLPFYERYTFKNNVWCGILTFYGLWCWQIYFYTVLCTRYTFSQNELRFNNVPICLFLITQGYFTLYHTLSDAVLRSFYRWAQWPMEEGELAKAGGLVATLVYALFVGLFSVAVAFMETFTIQHFEPYEIHDREAMYKYGSVFYALYFVVSFPMHVYLEEAKTPHSLKHYVMNAFATCGMVTLLLDMWRMAIGSIVQDCPFQEAHLRLIPFVMP